MPLAMNAQTESDVPEGYAKVTLTAGDVWEDGSGYQMLLDADADAYGSIIPENGGLTSGGDASDDVYAEFEYKIPENADGSCSSENIVINNSISILIPAGVYDWCITNPTPGDRIWIASGNGNVGGRFDDYEFRSGVAYEFTVTLGGNGNDQVDVTIDDPTAPVIPTDVVVTPTMTTGKVEWVAGENNATWNLRWRPWVDPNSVSQLWDLPLDGYEEQVEGWSLYDADGDGYSWGLAYSNDNQDDVCFYSASYYNNSALSPDNWLITPEVSLGGTLKFKTWNRSSSYLDKIMVYVCNNPEFESLDEFVAISDFIQPTVSTSASAEEIEIDLSEYEGTGYIAFRHYDCYDEWQIYIDDIEVIPANPAVIPDWIVVENLNTPTYTIEDLTPETQYEVQVMAFDESGEKNTDWTTSVIFTTHETLELVDGQNNLEIIEEYAENGYVGDVKLTGRTLYKDGGWNTLVLPFAVEDIDATPLAGAIVKTLESASFDNGTLTLNFSEENLTALDAGVPYIVKWAETGADISDPVFSNVKISAETENVETDVVSFIGTYNTIDFGTEVNTSVFLMGAGNSLFYPNGEANSYVNTCRAYFQLADGYELAAEANVGQNAKVVRIDFNFGDGHGIATGIVSLDEMQNNAGVYTLSGVKLDKATKKGVYIQNGRKVVIGKNR